MHYLIQIVAFQLLFLLLFDLFLRKETFFNANRGYLLLTSVLSFVLPMVDIPWIRETVPTAYRIELPAVIVGGAEAANTAAMDSTFSMWNWIWIAGAVAALGILVYKYAKIWRYRRKGSKATEAGISLIVVPQSKMAFSFLNKIYIGSEVPQAKRPHILMHEHVHVQQRHSWDLLYFEVLKVIFWFNPLVYIFQKRMAVLHEFIADAQVAKEQSKNQYSQTLLSEVFQTDSISFINTFFNHSLIKKRILMLQRSRSKRIDQWKYLLLFPVVAGMLFYTSCSNETPAQEVDQGKTDTMQQIADLKLAMENDQLTEEEAKALKSMIAESYKKDQDLHYGEMKKKNLTFGNIDKAPVFPGCESTPQEGQVKCFTQKVTEFVVQNFNTKGLANQVDGNRQRIAVQFTIDKSGEVSDIKVKANHQALIDEATRVAELLPKMTPGEHQGKTVSVQFGLPILFEIE